METCDVYKCGVCGNVVEVVHQSTGQLHCCGRPMIKLAEKSNDVGNEKHVPVIEVNEDTIVVRVGSVPHPMEENHYIEFIEISVDGVVLRKHLKPGDEPKAVFKVKGNVDYARAYCNIHGLWKK